MGDHVDLFRAFVVAVERYQASRHLNERIERAHVAWAAYHALAAEQGYAMASIAAERRGFGQ